MNFNNNTRNTNKNISDEEDAFWDCIEFDEDFLECMENDPEGMMVVYALKERMEEVREWETLQRDDSWGRERCRSACRRGAAARGWGQGEEVGGQARVLGGRTPLVLTSLAASSLTARVNMRSHIWSVWK